MMPCCGLTYRKYLNADGTVDWDAFAEAVIAGLPPVGSPENTAKSLADALRRRLCRCECHVKGSNIIH